MVLIVTQPDRPSGRGRSVRAGPIKRYARDAEIPFIQPEDVNGRSGLRRIREASPDLLLVIAFGQKIGPRLLALPRHGAINLHGSLLPKYRGAAPINWAVIEGETETGVTMIRMVDRMDAGDILGQRVAAIGPNETAGELHDRLSRLGARLVTEAVRDMVLDELEPRHQNETQVTLAPRLKKSDGLVDWRRPATAVHNQIRGTTPWPGAYVYLPKGSGKEGVRLVIGRTVIPDGSAPKEKPGTVVRCDDEGIDVATGDGAVRILEVTPAGKRRMSVADFVHGHSVRPGTRLSGARTKAGAKS